MIPPDPDNAPDTAAPVPWLDSEPAPTDSTGQAWRPVRPELPLIEISFSPSTGDRWRCHSRKTWTRPDAAPIIFGAACAWFFINDWMKYFSKAITTGQWSVPAIPSLRSSLINLGGIMIVVTMIQVIQSTIHVFSIHTGSKHSYSLEVTTERIRYISPITTSSFFWKDVRHITLYAGDIYIHGLGLDSCVYVPRTAFRSAESAKQLYAALIALWKSHGNPDTVPNEVRAEFALASD